MSDHMTLRELNQMYSEYIAGIERRDKEIADLRAKLAERDAVLARISIESSMFRVDPPMTDDELMEKFAFISELSDGISQPMAKADAEILAAAEDYVRDYDAGELADFNRLRQAIRSKQSAGDEP